MIGIAETYKEIELQGQKISLINFNCEHCGQIINGYGFNLSVFLYGAAFLVGKELRYVGITCPSCLNTILIKGDARKIFQQDMILFGGPNGSYLNPDLKYHSSVIYSPAQIEHLSKFGIPTFNCHLSENSKHNFSSMLATFLDECPYVEKDYLSSFIPGGEVPLGAFASLWWFKPEDIEKLVEIENEHQVRVFPRYVHKMSWYEQYDAFCWQYKVYNDYLASMKESASSNLDQLNDYAWENDINLDKLLEANPGLITEKTVEHLEKQAQEFQVNDIQAASNLLHLLVNFDPAPWDVPGPMSEFYEELWKSPRPFVGAAVPANVEEINQRKYKPKFSDLEVKSLADNVRGHLTKGHVQDWAMENHQNFIKDYIPLAHRSDFCYGQVWDLKCRYLAQVHAILDKAKVQEAKYEFFAEGPTWTIIFNGKALRGLRGSGFRYLLFLVKNQRGQYHTNQLNEIDAKPENTHKFLDDKSIEQMIGSDEYTKTDNKAESQYKARLRELQETISEAEKNNDMGTYEKASEEYEAIIAFMKKDFRLKGVSRNFRDDSDKIKDKIGQAIRRAVLNIKKHDPEIANHFQKALQPINTFQQCYNPEKQIDWHFKS